MGDQSRSIALLHFAGPPVVGGVESVMGHHARLMADAGHTVRIIGGRGEQTDGRIPFFQIPLVDSQHSEILDVKQQLDRGICPPEFDAVVDKIVEALGSALEGAEVLFVHNVLTMSKNLMLTAALKKIGSSDSGPEFIAWHHDIAGTAERYQSEIHAGWPWNLVTEEWKDVPIAHVVVSKARKQELCKLFGIEPDSVLVIPSGIDADRLHKFEDYTARFADDFNVLQANPLLLLPVRITRRKNLELALSITAKLGERMPGATLIVTGPPGAHNPSNQSYLEELRALRRELGLEPPRGGLETAAYPKAIAHFLSEFSDTFLPDEVIADFYRLADALLITSSDEGFGIPIIEAGLSRIPIFCSDIAPFREIAEENAYYFSVAEPPETVADAIAQALTSDQTYALRQRIRARYSWPAVYERQIAPLLEQNA